MALVTEATNSQMKKRKLVVTQGPLLNIPHKEGFAYFSKKLDVLSVPDSTPRTASISPDVADPGAADQVADRLAPGSVEGRTLLAAAVILVAVGLISTTRMRQRA